MAMVGHLLRKPSASRIVRPGRHKFRGLRHLSHDTLQARVRVSVSGHGDRLMTEHLLYDLQVHAVLAEPGPRGVAERVKLELVPLAAGLGQPRIG